MTARHTSTLRPIFRALCVASFACALLAACLNNDPRALIQSARDYQAKGDHRAAIIQLKNALQKQPENGEARLLLGESNLIVGDPASAEKEFRKAAEFGQPAAIVVPQIATAMLENGEPAKVVEEFSGKKLDDPRADARLRVAVGLAQLRLRKGDEASASFAAALASDPDNLQAKLGQARIAAMTGHLDEAISTVDQIVASNPKASDALLLQGGLRLAKGDRAGARSSLEQAVAAEPAKVSARLELIGLLIAGGDLDAASAQLKEAREGRAGDLRLVYLDGLVAYERKDLAKARELSQQLVKRAPEHVPSLVLAGAVELEEKQSAMAENYLQKAVVLAPQNEVARKLLARAQMATNQPSRALEAIQPLLASGQPIDPGTMMLAGEIYLANGDLKQASNFFNTATQSKSQETAARIRLGQIAMVTGDPERGIRELETATSAEGAPVQADLSLIAGYMRRNETAKALEAAQALVKKQPKEPIAYQLLGSVHAARKEMAAARAAYQKALEVRPSYLPAVAGLARVDLAENKPAEARSRFEAVVAREPNNDLALLGLAEILALTKAPSKEVATALQRAIVIKPQSVTARVALVNLYLQEKDTRAALQAAQEATVALPNDPRVLDALGRAQMAAGEANQALETFTRLAAAQPQSTAPLLRIAAIHNSRKETNRAIEFLLRAQKLAPTDAVIARDLVLAYLLSGKVDDALKQAKAYQSAAPKSAAGFLLEGDVYSGSRQWVPAGRAYRDALKIEPQSVVAALKLHGVLIAEGKKADADALARKWIAEHPNDTVFRSYLAEQALKTKDLKSSVALYQAIIAQQPNDVAALNNLAWASGQLGDEKAIGYAERALQLAPDSPLVLDTAGVILVDKGDTAKGLEYLARAVSLAPERHDIRLNYAKALLKAGRTDDARKELTRLQGVEQDFNGKSEVAELLKKN